MQPPATPLPEDAVPRFLGGLWQLNRRLKQIVGPVLAAHTDLDLPRYVILQTILHGADYPKQLSAQLGIIPTQLSRSLDQLQTLGLIERHLDAHDSRRTRLTLTPAGQALTQQASQAIHQTLARRLQALDADQLTITLAAIDLLAALDLPPETDRPESP
jgi:MarR family transcriptional regulator, organic hydroperoxide resistance regulator